MAGRTPHPVIDADRRGDIRLRQAEPAAALKRLDKPHVFPHAFRPDGSQPQSHTDWLIETGVTMTLAAGCQVAGSNWGTSICSPLRRADCWETIPGTVMASDS